MEEDLECEVCFQSFNEDDRQPRALPCGHSLCTVCINNGITKEEYKCPSCRNVHSVSAVTDIPINFSLLNVVRTVAAEGKLYVAATRKKQKLAKEPQIHAGLCPDHQSHNLFWCSTCSRWVCQVCTVSDHSSGTCSVIPINKAFPQMKETDLKLLNECEGISSMNIGCLNSYREKVNTCCEKQKDQRTALHVLIQRQQKVGHNLKKEKKWLDKCLLNCEDALKNVTASKNRLVACETNKDIVAAQRQSRKFRKIAGCCVAHAQDRMAKSETIEVSEKFQETLTAALKIAESSVDLPS